MDERKTVKNLFLLNFISQGPSTLRSSTTLGICIFFLGGGYYFPIFLKYNFAAKINIFNNTNLSQMFGNQEKHGQIVLRNGTFFIQGKRFINK